MTTAIDTNVIVALWDRDPSLNFSAQSALDAALARGTLVISSPVFAELLASPAAAKFSWIHFSATPPSAWTGNSIKPSGESPGGPSAPTQDVAANILVLRLAASLPIS